jgi:hypothetical protein
VQERQFRTVGVELGLTLELTLALGLTLELTLALGLTLELTLAIGSGIGSELSAMFRLNGIIEFPPKPSHSSKSTRYLLNTS